MSLQITINKTGYVTPKFAILDTGWTISGIYAVHTSCNSGNIISQNALSLVAGKSYVVTYTVDSYKNGGVRAILGTTQGTLRTANGTYTEVLLCAGIPQLSFFSDGALRISLLKFYNAADVIGSGTTISFNEGENKWSSEYSYQPELLIKFVDSLFSIKNGQLYEHNTNQVRNNFYGQQYPTRLTFVANKEHFKDKIWFNIRLDAKGGWSAPIITTAGSNQFPNGMLSRLKTGNFKLIDGKLWSDFLSDYTDPNFAGQPQINALFNGRKLQGGWLVVEMENNDTTDARIASIELYYIDVMRAL